MAGDNEGPANPNVVNFPKAPVLPADLAGAAASAAKLRRALYLAYLAEGFTEPQALELCTK